MCQWATSGFIGPIKEYLVQREQAIIKVERLQYETRKLNV